MANNQAHLSSTFQSLPRHPEHVDAPNAPAGVAVPAPISSSKPVIPAVVAAVVPSTTTSSTLPSASASSPATSFDGWSQGPIILAGVLGGALVIALAVLGCFAIRRRRQWKKRNRDAPSMSETETLLSRRSMDAHVPPKYDDKRFDLENPAPVYLGKGQGRQMFPQLKTLHLLSRSISTTSSSSTLTNGSKRVYLTQPPIPTFSVTYDNAPNFGTSTGSTHAPFEHRSSLPDGFESFIYSLRSPQFIEGTIAKRLSVVSNASTVRFARDSHGWAAQRESGGSFATVFDEGQKETSPPPALGSGSRRLSQKPRIRPTPLLKVNVPRAISPAQYEDIAEEIEYQPTPLAPPPAQIRARSVTPTSFVVRRTASIESADSLAGPIQHNSKPTVIESGTPMPLRPGTSILHSAVAKGKISREEAESALRMRIALTP